MRAPRPHPTASPRESERPIFRDHGPPNHIEQQPRDFLALLADSVTLTIQGACERIAADLACAVPDRVFADDRIALLQRLIDDRERILRAHDGAAAVPRDVLGRHGWLAVHEARLNVRDAPDWWLPGRADAVERAAQRGAEWLESQEIDDQA